MRRLHTLLAHLTREDAHALVLTGGERPHLKTDAGREQVEDGPLPDDALLQLLFQAGGSRHVESLGPKATSWTVRIDKVGQVRISAVKRSDETHSAELTLLGREAMRAAPRSNSKRPPKGTSVPPTVRRPSRRPSEPSRPVMGRGAPTAQLKAVVPTKVDVQPEARRRETPREVPRLEQRRSEPEVHEDARQRETPRDMPRLEQRREAPPGFTAPVVAPSPPPASAPIASNAKDARSAAPFVPNRALARWLSEARSAGASDLHLVAGRPVLLRVGGELAPRGEPVDAASVEGMILGSVPPRLTDVLARTGSCDYALELSKFGRFRVNVARQRTGLKACLRLVALEIPTLESLGLPPDISKATEHHQGLIVVTGPTGHGKTTTLAAIVDIFNRDTSHHVITVEDPVEFVHPRKRALVSQREVGSHTRSFASALKAALREDPDVIVVGELCDQETVRMALSASETGHLVIGTMNTPSAARTIERLIDLFPAGEHPQVRVTLASGLRLIVGQRLVATPDRARRHVAAEVLPGSIPLSNLIRDGKTSQIPSLQQRGRGIGIVRLDDSLADLVRVGKVALSDAARYSEAPDELAATVRSPGHAPPLSAPQGPAASMPKVPAGLELDEPDQEQRGLLERAGAFFTRKGR